MPVVRSTAGVHAAKAAHHDPSDNVPGLEDACLGIDIGSHRTRFCIRVMSTEEEIVVENSKFYGHASAYESCDFPSALYLFDDDICKDVYLIDALLDQYPLVQHLMKKKDDPEFRRQLRRGMIALLSVIRDATSPVCRYKGLRIVKIGFTIPVQWGREFEDVYRGLLLEVFEMLDPNDEHNAVLFFDFGGHNMNGCLFGIARDPDRPEGNGFFRVGVPFGAGGGSEQWEHHIGQWISDEYEEDTRVPIPPDQLERFLVEFRALKGEPAEQRKKISLWLDRPNKTPMRITMNPEHIDQAWREGLSGPLRTARRVISRLLQDVEQGLVSSPLVVVSGGTVHNPAVKSRMTDLCTESGLPVVFTNEFDVRMSHSSAQVAKAAAFVVSEAMTVEQFFDRGAAIGLQMRQPLERGKPKAAIREWDDSGAVLLDRDGTRTTIITVQVGDEYRLICDPLFHRLPNQSRTRVPASRTYDLVYLGRRGKQGTWIFQLSRHGSGDNMHLELQLSYSKRRDGPFKQEKTLHLPLYFDGNSSCVDIGDINRDISELGLDLPPQPKDWEDMASDDSSSQAPDTAAE